MPVHGESETNAEWKSQIEFEPVSLQTQIPLNSREIIREKRVYGDVIIYMKREGGYSINLKTDLVKYNGYYDSMMGYI